MTFFHPSKTTTRQGATKQLLTMGLLILATLSLTHDAKANDVALRDAEAALENKDYQQAQNLFKQLTTHKTLRIQALYGLAKATFYNEQLDEAEDYINEVLEASPNNSGHLYIAAIVAGKQAQAASIFSKLSYARDAKDYFIRALELDDSHQPSLIGLIKFHQQAPEMAGGDKDAIPSLLKRLSAIDKRAAFSLEAPSFLLNKHVDKVMSLYKEALDAKSTVDTGGFKFEFAMLLGNQEFYQLALQELVSIELPNEGPEPDYAKMRLYQIGKMAAKSNSLLARGIESINQYAAIAAAERSISDDWINFRLAQLKLLDGENDASKLKLKKLMDSTGDRDLKKQIKSFLRKYQS